jgi:hypothetical protein
MQRDADMAKQTRKIADQICGRHAKVLRKVEGSEKVKARVKQVKRKQGKDAEAEHEKIRCGCL